MAWWTHLLFLRNTSRNEDNAVLGKRENLFAVFRRALTQYLYDHFVEVLYVTLSIFTYLYLFLTVIAFFFDELIPKSLPRIIDTLSEPYLGALGVYVVVREIERRKGRVRSRKWGELFAVIWFFFFITATVLTFFSKHYYLNELYKTIVTNALAALIIRIGTLIR